MQAEMVIRETTKVLGVQARIHPQEADYNAIWGEQFDPRLAEIEPLANEEGYYGVYFDCGEPPLCHFLAGMGVGEVADVPAELVLREVPAGTYALFTCTMAEIAATWQQIMAEWLPTADYAYDQARPSIEWYAPTDDMVNGETRIYVPVMAK